VYLHKQCPLSFRRYRSHTRLYEVEQDISDEIESDEKQRALLTFLSSGSSSVALASSELQALQALYDALGGKYWRWLSDTVT